jgi:maltooligosyltrehalose trehalohydrolase
MTTNLAARAGWSLGAQPVAGGTRFTVPSPEARSVEVSVGRLGEEASWRPLERLDDGTWSVLVPGAVAGGRYLFRVDGGPAWPDPASRFQPDGVHAASQIIDPAAYQWQSKEWTGIAREDAVIYELHVGTFTPEGTFAAARLKLPWLKALGVTAVQLMPIADFPGRSNWGYDGVALFAPARCYGHPDQLRAFVDHAHQLGLAVYLDVVYNHLGPDGAYMAAYLPRVFSTRHSSPWGRGLNFDEEGSALLRRYFIENAVHWVVEYRIDGLRFDATHAIVDDSPRHVLAEVTAEVRQAARGRHVQLIAEDNRNLASMMRPPEQGGLGFDAAWADDFHHQMRRLLAGDADGYYADFTGRIGDVAATLRQGWFFRGQYSGYQQGLRGSPPEELPYSSFVIAIQNHDQVGNRAFGERLHHQIDAAAYRAASTLLLLAPETPLMFMGQEWAAGAPFLFFTDHEPALGKLVTEGRRKEFQRFESFSRPDAVATIPDPQHVSTFERSRLNWDESLLTPHSFVAQLYRAILALRRQWQTGHARRDQVTVTPVPPFGIAMVFRNDPTTVRALAVWLQGAGSVGIDLPPAPSASPGSEEPEWRVVLTTESAKHAERPEPPGLRRDGPVLRVDFARPGAVAIEWPAGSGVS